MEMRSENGWSLGERLGLWCRVRVVFLLNWERNCVLGLGLRMLVCYGTGTGDRAVPIG